MKKVVYTILSILGVYLVLCFCGNSKFYVSRNIDVLQDDSIVSAKLLDLEFFNNKWSPWRDKDPQTKVLFTGKSGIAGYAMKWESKHKEVGNGTLTYKCRRNDSIMMGFDFDNQGESPVCYVVKTNSKANGMQPNSCNVTWTMYGDIPFIARGFMLFFNFDKMIGPDYEKGLQNFKKAVEDLHITNYNSNLQFLTQEGC